MDEFRLIEDNDSFNAFDDVLKGDKGDDGFSPAVTITPITGGHTVTITDAQHPITGQSFNVMDGVTPTVGNLALLNYEEVIT